MSKFEQVEQLTMLVKNAVKRPPTSEEEASYNSIFMLCEMGKELEKRIRDLEAENADLKNQLKAALERC